MNAELVAQGEVDPNRTAPWQNRFDLDHFPDMVVAIGAYTHIAFINKAGATTLGYTPGELTGKALTTCVSDASLPDFENRIKEGDLKNFVCKMVRKDGSLCYVSWTSFGTSENDELLLTGRDVSELIHTRQQQLVKEHLFQALIDNSFDLLALTDENGKYLFVSTSLNQLFGYPEGELLGKNCFDYIHPDDLPRINEQFKMLLFQNKKIQVPPYRFKSANGAWLWMEAIVTNQLDHPDIQGVVVSVRDINQQVQAEKAVKEMQLMQALMEGEEKERSRIARDLHDGIAGLIAAAKMHFNTVSSTMDHLIENKAYLQGMDLLEHASVQVRRTSHNLMPEILLENGLAKALDRYCTSVHNDALQLVFLSVGTIQRYAASFELALYRIAQELISNIIRHAQATQALVQLSQQGKVLLLSIEDNGIGFLNHRIKEGTGLTSIRRRVTALHGLLEINSGVNKGTQIYIEFSV